MSQTPPSQFQTPDITAAQILSVVSVVVAQVVAFGFLDAGTAQTIIAVAGVVVPAVWTLADAYIRHGRATGSAAR